MSDLLKLSGRLGSMTNLVHGFIYFAPEASEEFDALGLPADHHYFASRGAALGPVSAEVIVATFYNFNPALVAAVIPAAWSFVDPTQIQQARIRACWISVGSANDHAAGITAATRAGLKL